MNAGHAGVWGRQDQRSVTAQQLVGEFYGRTGGFKEGLALAFNAPPIFALGATGGFELHLQNKGEGGPARPRAHRLGHRECRSQAALMAETSNSSVIFSLTRTPPVSSAAFQVTP